MSTEINNSEPGKEQVLNERQTSDLFLGGLSFAAGTLLHPRHEPIIKEIVVHPNETEDSQVIDPQSFDNPFLVNWADTAYDRTSGQYFYLTAIHPIAGLLRVLSETRTNKVQRKRLKARLKNILCEGGSWFGINKVDAQVINMKGAFKQFEVKPVDNKLLGRNGSRKTATGDVLSWNSFFNTLALFDLDLYFSLWRATEGQMADKALACIKDPELASILSDLFEIPVTIYENSVSQQLAWVRGRPPMQSIVDRLLYWSSQRYKGQYQTETVPTTQQSPETGVERILTFDRSLLSTEHLAQLSTLLGKELVEIDSSITRVGLLTERDVRAASEFLHRYSTSEPDYSFVTLTHK